MNTNIPAHLGGFEPTTGAVPDDLSAEIGAAFTNVSEVIKYALSSSHPSLHNGWDQVFHITSYHVNLDQTRDEVLRCMLEKAKKWCPMHKPTWTLIGVDKLALPTMRVEVEVRAYAGA
jgi:non-canonical poly(A) RNA polymerase PAPD5/7